MYFSDNGKMLVFFVNTMTESQILSNFCHGDSILYVQRGDFIILNFKMIFDHGGASGKSA